MPELLGATERLMTPTKRPRAAVTERELRGAEREGDVRAELAALIREAIAVLRRTAAAKS